MIKQHMNNHMKTDIETIEMDDEETTEKLLYHVVKTKDNEGTDWRPNPERNRSRVNDDTPQVDLGRKICSIDEAIKGRNARPEVSNKKIHPTGRG